MLKEFCTSKLLDFLEHDGWTVTSEMSDSRSPLRAVSTFFFKKFVTCFLLMPFTLSMAPQCFYCPVTKPKVTFTLLHHAWILTVDLLIHRVNSDEVSQASLKYVCLDLLDILEKTIHFNILHTLMTTTTTLTTIACSDDSYRNILWTSRRFHHSIF